MKNQHLIFMLLILTSFISCKKKEDDALTTLNKSLVLYYPFNGDAKDAGPNHINGTLKNGPVFTIDHSGNANRALLFDGVDDFVQADPSVILDNLVRPFTCSAWVRIDDWYLTTQFFAPFYIKSGLANDSVQCRLIISNSNDLYWFAPNDCGAVSSGFFPSLNNWFNITVVEDLDDIRLYINGVLKDTYPCSDQVLRNNYPLLIGIDPEGATEYLNGAMDEVRMYNKALSPDEVKLIQ